MGYARCIVTAHLLIDALHLPADTEIHAVRSHSGGGYCDIELTLSHPDLKPPVEDGIAPPLVTPSFHTQPPIVFAGWNQDQDDRMGRVMGRPELQEETTKTHARLDNPSVSTDADPRGDQRGD